MYLKSIDGLKYDQIYPNIEKYFNDECAKADNDIDGRKAHVFTNLEQVFKKEGLYEDADKLYYIKKVVEARKGGLGSGEKFLNWCFDAACMYGTNLSRLLMFSLKVVFFFSFIYFVAFLKPIASKACFNKIIGKLEAENTNENIIETREKDPKTYNIIICRNILKAFFVSGCIFTNFEGRKIKATKLLNLFVMSERLLGKIVFAVFIVMLTLKYFMKI